MTEEEAKSSVISMAESQEGYTEKASNADLDDPIKNAGSRNYTKYARDLDALGDFYNGKKNGPAGEWCDIFVDWCFRKCFGDVGREMLYQPPKSYGAGVGWSAKYYQQHNAWSDKPQLASQIFFRSSGKLCHTGLVIGIRDGNVITIEGNSKNMVRRLSYKIGAANIDGYGIPNWKLVADVQPSFGKPYIDNPDIRRGAQGSYVEDLQAALVKLCYDLGNYGPAKNGIDGDFGELTEKAVRAFQRDHKDAYGHALEVDGIAGPLTWQALADAIESGEAPTHERDNGTGENYLIYTIKKGDTLTKIASAHRTTVQALKILNGISNVNKIYAGQKIRIPV